ncbi:trypsin-like peptidase domain-containing protein [Acidisoma sp. L85]|uniref:trypsin-like peptidase domain-containing protein n=1 Tax=Acidisoma sp. L85 TaxID=1641850 RepID=UPI00131CC0AE|nr:trypsin-like peptidase domain-containing protein [Acidisoma sp. L85]
MSQPSGSLPFGNGLSLSGAAETQASGFIIGADGTILTDIRVVLNASTALVTLDSGAELSARVLGRDIRSGIAVLKVEASKPLLPVTFADSSTARSGEWVVSMGNPLGLGPSANAGIISALGRNTDASPYDQLIRIEAPMNSGDSGGPLFDQDGRVIGVMTAISLPPVGPSGVGFAVPSEIIRPIASEIEAVGHVVRGYIGVSLQALTPGLSEAFGLGRASGALITKVQVDGPAAAAGLQPGDVIQALNGRPVQAPRDLVSGITALKPGERARLDIFRGQGGQLVVLRVIQLPDDRERHKPVGQVRQEEELGLTFEEVSSTLVEQLGLPPGTNGAVITEVEPGSPGDASGLQVGDVVVGVGLRPVTNMTKPHALSAV